MIERQLPFLCKLIWVKIRGFPVKKGFSVISYETKKHPRPLHKANEQGIKKGRISIQKFLFCDTNSMTRFCYSIHQSPNFYTPFICFRVSGFHIIYHTYLFPLLSSSLSVTIDTF